MRLIDADKILEKMQSVMDMQDLYLPTHFKEMVIDEMPAVDAVEVVMCKDCKFYDPLDANRPYDCMYMDSIFGDDYCSRGVKLPKSVDAEPIRHGHWELIDGEEPRRYGCSQCKRMVWHEENYCPNCGARMDEDDTAPSEEAYDDFYAKHRD